MPFLIGSAIAAGGLAAGSSYLGGKASDRERRRLEGRQYWALQEIEPLLRRSFGQREALTRQAGEEAVAGYTKARREASRLGRGSRRRAIEGGQRLEARASQGLADRGLGSTTIGANLSRGIASDTQRQLSDVNEGLADLYGNLAIGEAGARSAGTEALSGLTAERANALREIAAARHLKSSYTGSLFGGVPQQLAPKTSLGQSLIAGAQTGLGFYGGMGGFGGGGGQSQAGGFGGIDPNMLMWMYQGGGGGGYRGGYGPGGGYGYGGGYGAYGP